MKTIYWVYISVTAGMFLLPASAFAVQLALVADVTSGSPPLIVNFSSPLAVAYPSNFYIIDYGDGIPGSFTLGYAGSAHTYTTPGTYTATLKTATNQCANIPNCTQPLPQYTTVGTLTITISGSQSVPTPIATTPPPTSASQTMQGALVATPSSGAVPITISYTGVAATAGSYSITFGDGVSTTVTVPSSCASVFCPLIISHTYATGGTYQTTITNGSQALSASVVLSGSVQTPSQPTTLPLSFTCPTGQYWNGYQCVAQSTPSPTAPFCPVFSGTLSQGSRGGQVTQLQNFLVSKGFLTSDLVTGYFGSFTRQSVIAFQSHNELPPVGIVGPLTRAAIMAACAQ